MGIEVQDSSKIDDVAEDDFLAELKLQFEKEIDLRENLDSKANTMITIASGISTLLIAIGTFLISRIADKNVYYGISIAILAIGIVLAIIGISFFIRSYSLRKYKYAMGTDYFFDKKTGEYEENHVKNVRNLSKKEFKDRMFKGYIVSIKTSGELNHEKASGIKTGQKFLTLTIITVGFLVAFVLSLMGLQMIRLG